MLIEFSRSEETPSIIKVLCDGDPWREIHTAIFGKSPKLPKNCLDGSTFEIEFFALEVQLAKASALRRLSMQSMLSSRLREFLSRRLVSQKAIDVVLSELIEAGFINDKSYVESFVRTQKARKFGPRAIAQKLQSKGVKPNKQETEYDPEEQKSAIIQLLKTRFAKRNLKDPKEKQRTIAALAGRGFDFPLILSLLRSD